LNENTLASNGFSVQNNDSIKGSASTYIRGGTYKGIKQETFLIEKGTEEVTIEWISTLKDTSLTIEDPVGGKFSHI
jgi:hypothetical protein